MIKSFRHKGLEDFFYDDTTRGINPQQAFKLRFQLSKLDAAQTPQDMNLPGYRFHPLQPKKNKRYAIRVSGAWRLTFEFEGTDVIIVDYEEYH